MSHGSIFLPDGVIRDRSYRIDAKIKKNDIKYGQSKKQNWRDWQTFEEAIAHATPTQIEAWRSFEQYRLIINNHKTFDHMRVWQSALNTGDDSRYLQAIAGIDTLILSPRESAKAQPLTEPVLTPDGWRLMGDLKVGDRVIAADGNTTQITRVNPQGIKQNYKITFDDGAFTYCSINHLWQVLDCRDDTEKVLPLNDLFEYQNDRFLIPAFGLGKRHQRQNLYQRAIASIEYVGESEMRCITIAHPSQLYVTRDCIVTHNSTYLAQWVSYQFGMHLSPWGRLALKVLGVSYNIDTAMPRSRQIQSLIESTKFQEIFPWCRPSKKKWGEKEWMLDLGWAGLATTEEQYSYVCAGLTGAINSRRCLAGGTLLTTPLGKMPIAQIKAGDTVLSWNPETRRNEHKAVEAIAITHDSPTIALTTKLNRALQCTPDHRIFVLGQGYKDAQDLVRGDRLLAEDGYDYVEAIEEGQLQTVYDIQVADNHNFFANEILSHNCHLVLLDDLIKSPEAIRAQSVKDAMVSNWENVIQFTRYDGSRAVCLGTRMTADDIYCTTFTPSKGWKVIEQSALLEREDGTEYSFWEPEHDKAPGMPLSRLQEERERTPIAFSFQRQNRIVRVKEQSINPELIQRGTLPTRFDTLVMGVDLSAGRKESNDYTAAVLGGLIKGYDKNPDQYWIIDCWEDRIMGNIEKLDAIAEMWEMWCHLLPTSKIYNHETGEWSDRPTIGLNLFFDSSAYGLSLQGDYESYILGQKKIVDWTVHPVPASGRGDKLYRLRKHTGLFTNKVIFFNLYGRTMPDGRRPMGRLIQQITEFGSTAHDDVADAFELCMTGLRSYLPMSKGNY